MHENIVLCVTYVCNVDGGHDDIDDDDDDRDADCLADKYSHLRIDRYLNHKELTNYLYISDFSVIQYLFCYYH